MLQIRSLFLPASLLLLLHALGSAQSPMVQPGDRKFVRVLFFEERGGKPAVGCQYSLTWGAPEWREEHQKALEGSRPGTRLRLGKDAWTTLDTNRPLVIGGTKVPVGIYYLVLEKTAAKKLSLVLLDVATVQKAVLDPFQSDQTKGGLVIPLTWAGAEEPVAALDIQLTPSEAKPKEASLKLAFGPHRLSAPITAEF